MATAHILADEAVEDRMAVGQDVTLKGPPASHFLQLGPYLPEQHRQLGTGY